MTIRTPLRSLRALARALPVAAVALGVTIAAGACSGVPTADQYVRVDESLKASFTSGHVADALGWSCGTLDCHGQVGRNLRLYSQYGLRLAPADVPGNMPITDHEVDADFRAVVGLEPEIIDQVVAEGGANPERLSLIRKGRGTEHHKGGTLMAPGDPLDTCLVTWLAGTVDANACDQVIAGP